jgi:hypothetical protein
MGRAGPCKCPSGRSSFDRNSAHPHIGRLQRTIFRGAGQGTPDKPKGRIRIAPSPRTLLHVKPTVPSHHGTPALVAPIPLASR